MAKIREILGDDLQLLIDAGASEEKIKQLAKTKYKYYKEMKTLNKYNQVDENGNIKEKKMSDVADFIEESQKHKGEKPRIIPTTKKEALKLDLAGDDVGSRIKRGLATTADKYLLLGAKGLNKLGADIPTDTLKAAVDAEDELSAQYTKSQQSPLRQKESEALAQELAKAKGVSQTAKAGAKLMLDKLSHPGEWDVAGGITEMITDPLNLVAPEAGAIAKFANASKAVKAGVGAGAGAVAQGTLAGASEYALAKAQDKSDEEAKKAGIVGGAMGSVMGGVLGGISGAFAKSAKPKIKEKIKAKSANEINDKLYADATGKKVDEKTLDGLLDNELLQIDEAEQHSTQAKPIIEQISTQAQTPEEINAMVTQYAPPTQKELQITIATNDGKEVSPRFAGMRVRDALIKSIENPQRTPMEMYGVLKNEGFTDEKANAIVQAYTARDVSVFDDFVSEKLSDIIDTEVVDKIKQLENKDDKRVRDQAEDGKRDATSKKSGYDASTSTTRAENGADTEQTALHGSEQGSSEAIRDDGQRVSEGGETNGVLAKDEGVDGHKTAGSDSTDVPRSPVDEVVPDEDAVHTGTRLAELSKHRKFEEHLKNRENVLAKEAKSDKKQISKGALTKEGDYILPTYEKNWLSDFELSKADVKKIREGKADPTYYNHEAKVEEKFDNLPKKDEDVKFDDEDWNWFDEDAPIPEDLLNKTKDKKIGKNIDGNDIFEDEKGVRYTSNNGLFSQEAVRISGNEFHTRPIATKSDEFLTQKEYGELYGQDRSEDNKNRRDGESSEKDKSQNKNSRDADNGNERGALQRGRGATDIREPSNPTRESPSHPPKTKKERRDTNAKVEEIIKKPVEKITAEDKKVLENYTGKGGLESGTKESLTQHYTDKKTVDAIYKALEDGGVKFDRVLEPAVGSGNFLKGRKGKFTTVDIDKTNHEVVKRLYPDSEHIHSGYESYKPKEPFDLIISNVPFSEERGAGRLAHRPDVKALHDHFFIKALEDVKDDGVVAFVTSKGVMDKVNPKIRKEITSQADVIGAYRLPDSAFKHTHTNVVTDVIFLQKRPKGVESRMEFANKAFESASKDENGIVMNDYYRKYQDNILGEMKAGVDPMYGKPTYLITGDADYSKMKINYKPYGAKKAIKGEAKASLPKNNKPTLSDRKVELLERIKETLDPKLVKEYKDKFKKHPFKDRGLKAHFKEDMDTLHELGSYFDEKFEPAEIFYKNARYKGSGKIEVTERSPLKERLIYNEDTKGIIDLNSAKFIKEDIDKLLESGYAYLGDGKIQNDALYYAGNIYKKIDEAMSIRDRDVSSQIATLKELIPTPKKIEEISFKGNEPWLLDNDIKIYKLEKSEKWVKLPNGAGERKVYEWKSEFGTIYDNYLNNRKLISAKDGESDTAFKRRLREAESRVKDVQSEIKSRAEAQREEIEALYNRKYNFYRSPDYSKLEYMISDVLKELPKGFNLRETQKKFIIKALYEGKNINAHDVGGGKTFAGIVLGRALKKKGIAHKPLYVVPSKVIKNWQKEILQLYPDAKIVNLGNLNKTTRSKKLFALANQNADFVLISQEGFKELKLPSDVEGRYASELLMENLRNDDLKGRAKAIQAERIKTYLATLAQANSDKRITLDKLGIDAIIADEARAFKNIGVRSSLARLGLGKPFGLSATKTKVTLQSALAYDFRFKTRYISERNNNSNIYMLDATPTPNKPLELFTMLKHLDNRIFDEYNIKTDEDFVNQFLETGSVAQKSGGYKDAITGIKNVFELRSIMDRYIDRISMQEFKEKGYIDIPESKVYKHIVEASDESDIVFSDIHDRLAKAKSDVQKRKDVLGIYSNGVTASVDPRLYAKDAISELAYRTPENNKIDKVLQLISEARAKDKKAGQIVFVDNAGHSAEHLKMNLHQEIKQKLMKQGFRDKEVAIISGQEITNVKTGREQKASGNRMSEMKQEIVDAYNHGKVKVVIGTTKSAGEGMNIQKFTKDIYHIDLPWTPAEITQRNGRGVRYGNINKEVNIHYMFTQGSFDDLMFNTVTKKKGWNDLIWDAEAKSHLKIADSEGGGLPSPDEIMLAMEKDPIKRRELELKIEHEKLEDNLINIEDEVRYQEGRVRGVNADIADLQKRIAKAEKEIKSGEFDTKEMRELALKARKSPLAKKKYEKKAKEMADTRARFLKRNQERLEKLKKIKEQSMRDLETANKDLESGTQELERFEAENLDDSGRYKSGLEEC